MGGHNSYWKFWLIGGGNSWIAIIRIGSFGLLAEVTVGWP